MISFSLCWWTGTGSVECKSCVLRLFKIGQIITTIAWIKAIFPCYSRKSTMLSFPRRENYIADRKNITGTDKCRAIWIGLKALLKLLQEGQCWFFSSISGILYSWCTSSLFGSTTCGTVVMPCLRDKLVLHSSKSFFMQTTSIIDLHCQFCYFIAVWQLYKEWMSLAAIHKLFDDVTVSRFLHKK